jgi:hypothetical protein
LILYDSGNSADTIVPSRYIAVQLNDQDSNGAEADSEEAEDVAAQERMKQHKLTNRRLKRDLLYGNSVLRQEFKDHDKSFEVLSKAAQTCIQLDVDTSSDSLNSSDSLHLRIVYIDASNVVGSIDDEKAVSPPPMHPGADTPMLDHHNEFDDDNYAASGGGYSGEDDDVGYDGVDDNQMPGMQSNSANSHVDILMTRSPEIDDANLGSHVSGSCSDTVSDSEYQSAQEPNDSTSPDGLRVSHFSPNPTQCETLAPEYPIISQKAPMSQSDCSLTQVIPSVEHVPPSSGSIDDGDSKVASNSTVLGVLSVWSESKDDILAAIKPDADPDNHTQPKIPLKALIQRFPPNRRNKERAKYRKYLREHDDVALWKWANNAKIRNSIVQALEADDN